MSYYTDRKRVIGLGSAKEGTGHWWSQRVTSVALIPLFAVGIWPLDAALGGSLADVRAIYADPFNAVVAILLIGVTFLHTQQGLQVVIEDYVHSKWARTGALLANTMLCTLFGLAGVFAVARIAFAG